MDEWNEFMRKCRDAGGEPEPIPCSWFNTYCEEGECIYKNEPIFADEEKGFYCCKEVIE